MFSTVLIKDELVPIISKGLKKGLGIDLSEEKIYEMLEFPPDLSKGHLSFPVFIFAKQLKQSPTQIAQILYGSIIDDSPFQKTITIKEIKIVGGYLNFFLDHEILTEKLFSDFLSHGFDFEISKFFLNYKLVMDFSSPNIAKPFGIGHLISTALGESIQRIYKELGSTVFGINYIGDWGTQFGKVVRAFELWEAPENIDGLTIEDIFNLYVRFNKEEAENSKLTEEARECFSSLEKGDPERLAIWKKFRDRSLKEFNQLYSLFDIHFYSFDGESKYQDKEIASIINILEINKILKSSEGAEVVFLDDIYPEQNIPPCLIRKTNGTTIYTVRDIAALMDRWESYNFDKIIYVVGVTQSLHFQQVFGVIKKLNLPFKNRLSHIPFGTMRFQGAKMATREGNIVFLKDVYQKVYEKALEITMEKGISEDPESTASKMAVGALNFSILKNSRIKDIDFNFDKVLSFEGDTSVYLQYTFSRLNSIIDNYEKEYKEKYETITYSEIDPDLMKNLVGKYFELFYHTLRFEDILISSGKNYEPYILTRYLLQLCSLVNSFYAKERIIVENGKETKTKIPLVLFLAKLLEKGMNLLNIPVLRNL